MSARKRWYHRHPRSQNEKKAVFTYIEELGKPPRRTVDNLPDAWDDWYPGDHKDKNWKKARKTQYKVPVDKSDFADSTKFAEHQARRLPSPDNFSRYGRKLMFWVWSEDGLNFHPIRYTHYKYPPYHDCPRHSWFPWRNTCTCVIPMKVRKPNYNEFGESVNNG